MSVSAFIKHEDYESFRVFSPTEGKNRAKDHTSKPARRSALDSVWEDVDALRADAAIGACTTQIRLCVCRSTRDELCCARGRCCPVCSQRSRQHSVARGLAGRWKVFHVGTLPTGTPTSTRRRMSACSRL